MLSRPSTPPIGLVSTARLESMAAIPNMQVQNLARDSFEIADSPANAAFLAPLQVDLKSLASDCEHDTLPAGIRAFCTHPVFQKELQRFSQDTSVSLDTYQYLPGFFQCLHVLILEKKHQALLSLLQCLPKFSLARVAMFEVSDERGRHATLFGWSCYYCWNLVSFLFEQANAKERKDYLTVKFRPLLYISSARTSALSVASNFSNHNLVLFLLQQATLLFEENGEFVSWFMAEFNKNYIRSLVYNEETHTVYPFFSLLQKCKFNVGEWRALWMFATNYIGRRNGIADAIPILIQKGLDLFLAILSDKRIEFNETIVSSAAHWIPGLFKTKNREVLRQIFLEREIRFSPAVFRQCIETMTLKEFQETWLQCVMASENKTPQASCCICFQASSADRTLFESCNNTTTCAECLLSYESVQKRGECSNQCCLYDMTHTAFHTHPLLDLKAIADAQQQRVRERLQKSMLIDSNLIICPNKKCLNIVKIDSKGALRGITSCSECDCSYSVCLYDVDSNFLTVNFVLRLVRDLGIIWSLKNGNGHLRECSVCGSSCAEKDENCLHIGKMPCCSGSMHFVDGSDNFFHDFAYGYVPSQNYIPKKDKSLLWLIDFYDGYEPGSGKRADIKRCIERFNEVNCLRWQDKLLLRKKYVDLNAKLERLRAEAQQGSVLLSSRCFEIQI